MSSTEESDVFVQINTDNQIKSDAEANERLEQRVRERLGRFQERLTHVEIYISDENGPRGGAADMRASLEARVNGMQPIAVHENSDTVERAVIGAATKAASALDRVLGKLDDRRG